MTTRELEAYERILVRYRHNALLVDPENKVNRHTGIVQELLSERAK
jgi:hypothetical protein